MITSSIAPTSPEAKGNRWNRSKAPNFSNIQLSSNPVASGMFLERTTSRTSSNTPGGGLYRTETWDTPPSTVEAVSWSTITNPFGRAMSRRDSVGNATTSIGPCAETCSIPLANIGRTETWDRPPLTRTGKTGTEYFSPSSLLSMSSRTETWDRPPLTRTGTSGSEYFSPSSQLSMSSTSPLARTSTVLESSRVSASMPSSYPISSIRPATYPPVTRASKPPTVSAVPPTILRPVQSLPGETKTQGNASARNGRPSLQSKVSSGSPPAKIRRAEAVAASKPLASAQLRQARSPIPPSNSQVRSGSITFRRANTIDLSNRTIPCVTIPEDAGLRADGTTLQTVGISSLPLRRTCTDASWVSARSGEALQPLVRSSTVDASWQSANPLSRSSTVDSSWQSVRSGVSPPLVRSSTVDSSSPGPRKVVALSPKRSALDRTVTTGGTSFGTALSTRTVSVASSSSAVLTSKTRSVSLARSTLDSEKSGERAAHELDERGSSVPPIKKQPTVNADEEQCYQPVSPKQVGPVSVSEALRQVESKKYSKQLRLIVAGLMGSGKSMLCRMLAKLLGGTWVNQDEFSHKSKGAKKAFLAEISRASADKNVPVVLVDKINTQRQHRREIMEAMERGVAGDIVLLQLKHPSDPPESVEQQVKLCLSRIQARGECHRTLKGSDPKLASILRMTANGIEQMDAQERGRFKFIDVVDMTQPPIEVLRNTLMDLNSQELLRLPITDLLAEKKLQEAFNFTIKTEEDMAGSQKSKSSEAKPKSDGSQKKGGKKPPPLWIYVIEFDRDAYESIRYVWNACGSNEPSKKLNEEFHVTLLYLGGGSDAEIASRCSLEGPEEVRKLRDDLAAHEGTLVDIELREVVWDDRLAAAPVSGLSSSLCANLFPHITLALAPGVPPRVSNELLARRAANDDIKSGLGPWLEQLGLQQYKTEALEWCTQLGAASTEEIAENASDLAAHLENSNAEERDSMESILARAAPGRLCVTPLDPPLKLQGRVHGRLRGE